MQGETPLEECLQISGLCIDDILSQFEVEPAAVVEASPVPETMVSDENVVAASQAIDNILGEFEIDLGASGEGSIGDIENKGDAINLERKKPKTPPKRDKKVRGLRRPNNYKGKYKEGGMGGGEEVVMKPLKPAPPVPNSRFLKERETKRMEEEKLAIKAKKRVAKMKREKKVRGRGEERRGEYSARQGRAE